MNEDRAEPPGRDAAAFLDRPFLVVRQGVAWPLRPMSLTAGVLSGWASLCAFGFFGQACS